MIQLDSILTPARSRVNVPGASKTEVLESVARLFAAEQPALDAEQLLANLLAREKLGSTGFGNGIAIPHCRLAGCSSAVGALLQLATPVDFNAIDGAPVDLLFVLLVPESATEEHLGLLRQIASLFDNEATREQLRKATDDDALYQAALRSPILGGSA